VENNQFMTIAVGHLFLIFIQVKFNSKPLNTESFDTIMTPKLQEHKNMMNQNDFKYLALFFT